MYQVVVDKIDFIAHVYIQSMHKLARQWWCYTNLTPNICDAADVCIMHRKGAIGIN